MSKTKIICERLVELKARDVTALDMRSSCSWTSCLIIATVSSKTHMQSLSQYVADKMSELDMESRCKRSEDLSWRMIDGGEIVVSLMDEQSRSFYALEERWFEAVSVYS